MKNFLLSIFLLISVAAIAQEPIGVPTQNYNGTWARFGQYLSVDKGLLIPARDTNWIPKRAGALTFWGTDFWGYNGQQWKLVGTNVTQQVPADTTTTWIYFDRRYFKGEATIPSPITLSDSLLALINSVRGVSSDTAVQDIIGVNTNTLRVIKKTGFYDIVFGNGGGTDISGKADKTTTLTINGVTYDLSTSRSWTIASSGGDLLIANYVVDEPLTGAVNGTNTVFTFANPVVADKEMIFLNGVKQKRGVDYTMTNSTTATFTIAPTTDASGADYLGATYFKQ